MTEEQIREAAEKFEGKGMTKIFCAPSQAFEAGAQFGYDLGKRDGFKEAAQLLMEKGVDAVILANIKLK